MRPILLTLAIAVLIFYVYEDSAHSSYPPGVIAPSEPFQTDLGAGPTWQQGKVRYTARADISMRVRVLSTERYYFDGASVVSPVDFAVGWGRMSDQALIDQLSFAQGQRWYRYWPKGRDFPIPVQEIGLQSANMHMIPANKQVLKGLRSVRKGDLISLDGYLVSVLGEGGWRWDSSLTRTDTGNGACEVVYVRSLSIHRRGDTQPLSWK